MRRRPEKKSTWKHVRSQGKSTKNNCPGPVRKGLNCAAGPKKISHMVRRCHRDGKLAKKNSLSYFGEGWHAPQARKKIYSKTCRSTRETYQAQLFRCSSQKAKSRRRPEKNKSDGEALPSRWRTNQEAVFGLQRRRIRCAAGTKKNLNCSDLVRVWISRPASTKRSALDGETLLPTTCEKK